MQALRIVHRITTDAHFTYSAHPDSCGLLTEAAWTVILSDGGFQGAHHCLELLAFVVEVTKRCELRLRLVLEEGVVQHLVVDVQLACAPLRAYQHNPSTESTELSGVSVCYAGLVLPLRACRVEYRAC